MARIKPARKVTVQCPQCRKIRQVTTNRYASGYQFQHASCRSCSQKASKLIEFASLNGKHFTGEKIGKWKRSAEARNLAWNLTPSDLDRVWEAQGGTCALTGLPLVLVPNSVLTVSLDRIDSAQGYIPGNVQFLISPANRMKSNLPEGRFLWLCGLIATEAQNEKPTG